MDLHCSGTIIEYVWLNWRGNLTRISWLQLVSHCNKCPYAQPVDGSPLRVRWVSTFRTIRTGSWDDSLVIFDWLIVQKRNRLILSRSRPFYLLAFLDGLAFFSLLRSFKFRCFLMSSTERISFFPSWPFTRSLALSTFFFLFS
jgi:hypothetical protein